MQTRTRDVRIHRIAAACAAVLGAPLASPAWAQATLEPVVISVNRAEQRAFDAPAAIDAIDAEDIRNGGAQVNLSESLNRVPGISILNRQNYAQDLQLSIRGFGARSTFGIRGVRLIVDGIPATMPDGQGQASTIVLSSAQRIEVLRGPMAQLYGNAAGGVVQVVSEVGADTPTTTFSTSRGRFGSEKYGIKFAATEGDHKVLVDASTFSTNGARPHSAAERGQFNARWRWQLTPATRFDLVANALDQPDSEDPIGLTRELYLQDPTQTAAAAISQDAGKTVRQNQLGGVLTQQFGDATTLTARYYGGTRDLNNTLSIPPGAQQAATSAGGIVEFERLYSGLGVQLAHRASLGESVRMRLVGGFDADRMNEDRQGYFNTAGVKGILKRDEYNKVRNRDLFAQAGFDFGTQWSLTAGLRRSSVEFKTEDRFIRTNNLGVITNPDDSGSLDYSAVNPVLGVAFQPVPTLNLYANVGRGFETPTFTELAYRPPVNGVAQTGLNLDLKASRSRHAEIGSKWRIAGGHRLDVALYAIATTDEIVTDTNAGGRTTFKNATETSRRGVELSYVGQWTESLRGTLSVTWLKAEFDKAYTTGTGVSVAAGNKIPGIPQGNAFAELAFAPRNAWGGFNTALEVVRQGRIYVNDANADTTPTLFSANNPGPGYADAVTVLNLRVGFEQTFGGWQLKEGLRVDNATDKTYAGSVIVNDANGRFYEPALPRNATLWLSGRYAF